MTSSFASWSDRVSPTSLPHMRDALLREHAAFLAAGFRTAIATGEVRKTRQSDSDGQAAVRQANDEIARLASSDLFWVTTDMSELAAAAAQTLPDFSLEPFDLPSKSGTLVFQRPPVTFHEKTLPAGQLPVVMAVWGEWAGSDTVPHHGVWVTWYTAAAALAAEGLAAGMSPVAYMDNAEIAYGARVTNGDPIHTEAVLPLRVLKSIWLLMRQPLADVTDAHFDRPARRRMKREGIDPEPVRVINLRRRPNDDTAASNTDREWRHRWIVRGHWRQQPYGPDRSLVRPVWIHPHIKGPQDAPLLGGEKVHVLNGDSQ